MSCCPGPATVTGRFRLNRSMGPRPSGAEATGRRRRASHDHRVLLCPEGSFQRRRKTLGSRKKVGTKCDFFSVCSKVWTERRISAGSKRCDERLVRVVRDTRIDVQHWLTVHDDTEDKGLSGTVERLESHYIPCSATSPRGRAATTLKSSATTTVTMKRCRGSCTSTIGVGRSPARFYFHDPIPCRNYVHS
jgi:hypothetical protein